MYSSDVRKQRFRRQLALGSFTIKIIEEKLLITVEQYENNGGKNPRQTSIELPIVDVMYLRKWLDDYLDGDFSEWSNERRLALIKRIAR